MLYTACTMSPVYVTTLQAVCYHIQTWWQCSWGWIGRLGKFCCFVVDTVISLKNISLHQPFTFLCKWPSIACPGLVYCIYPNMYTVHLVVMFSCKCCPYQYTQNDCLYFMNMVRMTVTNGVYREDPSKEVQLGKCCSCVTRRWTGDRKIIDEKSLLLCGVLFLLYGWGCRFYTCIESHYIFSPITEETLSWSQQWCMHSL